MSSASTTDIGAATESIGYCVLQVQYFETFSQMSACNVFRPSQIIIKAFK